MLGVRRPISCQAMMHETPGWRVFVGNRATEQGDLYAAVLHMHTLNK
jgi:hypothetical protein